MHALLVRDKPRDLYDVWLLLNQGVSPDRALIERKLALYEMAFSVEALEEALTSSRQLGGRPAAIATPQFVEYKDVQRRVDVLMR